MLGEFANAATREIARQFRNTKADFTIINNSRDFTAALVYCRLVKKLIGVAYMHLYPTAGPNRLIQKAFNEGRIETMGVDLADLASKIDRRGHGYGMCGYQVSAGIRHGIGQEDLSA